MTPHEQVLHDRANELLMKGDRIGATEAYEQLATEHERAELFLKAVATLKLAYGLDPRPSIAGRIERMQSGVMGAVRGLVSEKIESE